MIEFGLILGAGVLALVLAAVLGSPLLSRSTKLRLITSAQGPVLASIRGFLRIHDRALLALVALIACAAFVGIGVVRDHRPEDPAGSSFSLAGWIVLGLVLGSLSTAWATRLAAHAIARSSHRIDDAAKVGVPNILQEAIRNAGATTIALGTTLLLTLTPFALAIFVTAGGLTPNTVPAASRAMASILTAYALGTVITCVLTQTVGGLFVCTTTIRNNSHPALVSSHLHVPVTHVTSFFSSLAITTAAATVVCAGAGTTNSLAVALCPLIAATFSLLASTVGVFVVRTDMAEPVSRAIDRGLFVTLVLNAATFVGLSQWLFAAGWWRMALASCCGLFTALAVLLIERSFRHGEGTRAEQMGDTLRRSSLLGSVLLVGALGGFLLGRSTEIADGGPLGFVFASLGMIAPAPYVLTASTFGAMMDRLLASETRKAVAGTERRLASGAAASSPRSYAILCATLVTWTATLAFVHRSGAAQPGWASDALQVGLVASAGFAGALLVAWHTGTLIRSITAIVCCLHPEPDPTRHAMAALNEAVRHGIPIVVLTVAVPAALFTAIRFGLGSPGAIVAATTALVLGASAVALPMALAGMRNSSDNFVFAPASSPPCDKSVDVEGKWANNGLDGVAVEGDTLGTPLQTQVAPCIHASVKLLATAALALAPLFF
jgi:K(+)-stimulated pyrophosphate-energized sodium pump